MNVIVLCLHQWKPTVHYNVDNCRNKWALRAMRKAGAEWSFLMCGEILEPQTEKACFPNWVRVRKTLVVEERSWRCPDSAVLNCTMLLRYAGPHWWWIACIKVAILNSIRAFTGSQWRRCSAGLTGVWWSSWRMSLHNGQQVVCGCITMYSYRSIIN